MSRVDARRAAVDRLAISGGTPVRSTLLSYGHQIIEQADLDAVTRVLQSDWLTTGPVVEQFEEAFARLVGAKHAIAVNSGTAALHAATFAAGIGPGDEVIVPALTFAASANCVLYQGGTVRFADVRPDTLCLDPASVERNLTDRTRAIVVVDYAGQPADLDEILALARPRGIAVIEDAAHAIAAKYRDRPVGTISDVTTFSLHPVKQMTTGEGGMITTGDDALAAKLRMFRSHGIASDARQREAVGGWYYEMVALGYNYRLTDFQSALGLAQLERLPRWLARRTEIANQYAAAFRGIPGIVPLAVLPDRVSSWHLYVVRLDPARIQAPRAEVFRALRGERIGVNVHYIPVPWHPYYQSLGFRRGGWPSAEQAYEQILTLPLWAGMSDADVSDVVAAVNKVVEAYGI